MEYREFQPHPRLRPWVALIWTFELDDRLGFGPPERILPDGIVELIFHWGDPFMMAFAGEAPARQPRSFALAQTRRFVEIAPAGRSGFISVRFRHGGGCHFMRPPVSSFADGLVGTRDLWGAQALALETDLGEARSAGTRVRLVERFLLDQLARHYKPDVDRLASALWQRDGYGRVSELCRDLGVGERRLERTARAALGLSPKQALSLGRFLRACALLRRAAPKGLADIALACGYYDQAHFHGDFKRLSGMTPKQFAADRSVAVLDPDGVSDSSNPPHGAPG